MARQGKAPALHTYVDKVWGQVRLDQATAPAVLHKSQDRMGTEPSWARLQHPQTSPEVVTSHAAGLKHLPAHTGSVAGNRPGRGTLGITSLAAAPSREQELGCGQPRMGKAATTLSMHVGRVLQGVPN